MKFLIALILSTSFVYANTSCNVRKLEITGNTCSGEIVISHRYGEGVSVQNIASCEVISKNTLLVNGEDGSENCEVYLSESGYNMCSCEVY